MTLLIKAGLGVGVRQPWPSLEVRPGRHANTGIVMDSSILVSSPAARAP